MSNKNSNFPNAAKPKATSSEIGELVGVMNELRRLPPVSKNDPEQVKERLDYYFQYCTENGVKCSVEGMTLALGKSRQTLWEWENDPKSEAGNIVSRAKELINCLLTQWSMDGKMPFPYTIWLQKNHFSYSDNKVLEIKPYTEKEPISLEKQLEDSGLIWDEEKGEFIPDTNKGGIE